MGAKRRVILLPCQGDPVKTVWLPKDRGVDGLKVMVWGMDVTRAARQTAAELGLTPNVRYLGSYAQLDLTVYITWVRQDESPRGLVAESADTALRHPLFGSLVRAIREAQSQDR